MAKFKIKVKQEGKGKAEISSFGDLQDAKKFILDFWQGAEYIDSSTSFHSDYSTFDLVGFSLKDIGSFDFSEGFRNYHFANDASSIDEFPEDNGDYYSTYLSQVYLTKSVLVVPDSSIDDAPF